MDYKDFNINEEALEEMAKEFAKTKVMQENVEDEENDRENQSLIYDIFSGFKILERLLFVAKNQTKNQSLLNFIHDNQNQIELIWQELLKISNDVLVSDIDFELPQNDEQIVKMIQNIVAGQMINLTELLKDDGLKDVVMQIFEIMASFLKEAININFK